MLNSDLLTAACMTVRLDSVRFTSVLLSTLLLPTATVPKLRFSSEATRLEPGTAAAGLASKAWHPTRVVRARRRRVTLGRAPRSFTDDLFGPYAHTAGDLIAPRIRVSNPKCD